MVVVSAPIGLKIKSSLFRNVPAVETVTCVFGVGKPVTVNNKLPALSKTSLPINTSEIPSNGVQFFISSISPTPIV